MDKYLFSYPAPSEPPVKRGMIRLVERAMGQRQLKRLYVQNQRYPRAHESFWQAAVRSLALDVRYDAAALAHVPKTGPVVFVANHPYGVLDGIVISWLVEKVRSDFVVLTHAVLRRAQEVHDFVLPIDFSGTEEAQETNLKSRAAARALLDKGGAVIVFPAGAVSTAPDRLGLHSAVDVRWQPFVSELIQRSKATGVAIWFCGQNGRLFQIPSHVSQTLRISLIFHEVKTRIGTLLPVAIGAPIPFEALSHIKDRQALADDLRARTYAMAFGVMRKPNAPNPAQKLMGKLRALRPKKRAA